MYMRFYPCELAHLPPARYVLGLRCPRSSLRSSAQNYFITFRLILKLSY